MMLRSSIGSSLASCRLKAFLAILNYLVRIPIPRSVPELLIRILRILLFSSKFSNQKIECSMVCLAHVHRPLWFIDANQTRDGWHLLTVKTVQMGTLGVHMTGVLPLFGSLGSLCRYSTVDFCSALAALVSPVKIYYVPHRTLFHFIGPHRPATWAGRRAGSPVPVSL
jgi:hypothetical protein